MGRTDNADHYYSWPPHYGGLANSHAFVNLGVRHIYSKITS